MEIILNSVRTIVPFSIVTLLCCLTSFTVHAQISSDFTWKCKTGLIAADWNSNTSPGYDAAWPNTGPGKADCGQTIVPGSTAIWAVPNTTSHQTVYFRKTFYLGSLCGKDTAYVRADDAYELYINGTLVGSASNWSKTDTYNIRPYLRCGNNLIAIKAQDLHAICWWLSFRADTNVNGNPPSLDPWVGTICPGQPIVLHAYTNIPVVKCSGTTYYWSGPEGFTDTTTTSTTTLLPKSRFYNSGIYTVIATNSCGSDTGTITVMVPAYPFIGSITASDTLVCPGTAVTLTAPSGLAPYHWSTGATTQVITVYPTVTTTYTVTVTTAIGCEYNRSVTIEVIPPPVVSLTVSSGSSCYTTRTITASVTDPYGLPVSYLWSPGGATTASISVSPTTTTTYSVTVTTVCGSVTQSTTVVPCPQLTGSFPSLLAANAMTATSNFVVFHSGLTTGATPAYNATQYRLRIYDRWGENIFERTEYVPTCGGFWNGQIRWDGHQNDGSWAPANNVYVYTLELANCNHSLTTVKSGNITFLAKTVVDPTATNDVTSAPERISFHNITPDPVTSNASIMYSVSESGTVSILLYDLQGNRVGSPIQDNVVAGTYRKDITVASLPAGIYYCRLSTGGATVQRKFTVVR